MTFWQTYKIVTVLGAFLARVIAKVFLYIFLPSIFRLHDSFPRFQIYFADQSQFPVAEDSELKEMDKRIASLTSEAVVLQKEISQLDSELTTVSNELTLDEAKTQLSTVKAEIAKGKFLNCP